MTALAVIGMAGRLPGAATLDEYWANLLAGRDCVTRRPIEELRGLVADDLLDDSRWVGASGLIFNGFDFDPAFFGMSPKEALITDPQHRLLLSTAAAALEDACLVPAKGSQRIGMFAGVGTNRHSELVRGVLASRKEVIDELAIEVGNVKDHAATKVAYRLDLRGPAIAVQSACSTGLVALHQAGLSLAGYECDTAIVGAASLRAPEEYGYLALPGGISSTDGYCRAFSSAASGVMASDGSVAVVLKRYSDAVAAGDRIHAVIRGSAVNNDGAKSGYAMVSSEAQQRLIRDALLFAEIDPEQVGAAEAHGSGTPLGDAVEWNALSAVYGGGSVVVGSVKSSIGHTREVAGLAGFVRMVCSVRDGKIPPTLHVGLPADFAQPGGSGLHLARRTQEWGSHEPRRGAVSAFGLGGTNAHVIVEQPPAAEQRSEPAGPALVLISAHSQTAAKTTAATWSEALVSGKVSLAEAADVGQSGRRHRRHRVFAVSSSREAAADELSSRTTVSAGLTEPKVCFVFPGIGDHYPGMAAGLRTSLPGLATGWTATSPHAAITRAGIFERRSTTSCPCRLARARGKHSTCAGWSMPAGPTWGHSRIRLPRMPRSFPCSWRSHGRWRTWAYALLRWPGIASVNSLRLCSPVFSPKRTRCGWL